MRARSKGIVMRPFLTGSIIALLGTAYLIALSACMPTRDSERDLYKVLKYQEQLK